MLQIPGFTAYISIFFSSSITGQLYERKSAPYFTYITLISINDLECVLTVSGNDTIE
jgi:hypothetical protein